MLKQEVIRSFQDNENTEVVFYQERKGNGIIRHNMFIYVNGKLLAVKCCLSYEKKNILKIITACEKAEYGLLQAVLSKLNW